MFIKINNPDNIDPEVVTAIASLMFRDINFEGKYIPGSVWTWQGKEGYFKSFIRKSEKGNWIIDVCINRLSKYD